MIGLKIPKLWAVGLVGLAMAFIGALGPAHPAAAAQGTGGVFYVDVGGNKVRVTNANTKVTLSPSVPAANISILDNPKGGEIYVRGIPEGEWDATD